MKALEGKGDAIFVQTDISDPDSAQHCVDEAVKAFGTVHILVNNAALYYDIDNFDPSFEYLQQRHLGEPARRVAHDPGRGAGDGEAALRARDQPVVGRGVRVHVPRVRRRLHRARQLQLLDHEVGHRRPHEVHGRAARQLEHHGELHRARRDDDRGDEEDRPRHVHPGHDRA